MLHDTLKNYITFSMKLIYLSMHYTFTACTFLNNCIIWFTYFICIKNAKLCTFCSKVWFKRFFLFEVFEDLHHTAAFPNCIPLNQLQMYILYSLVKDVINIDICDQILRLYQRLTRMNHGPKQILEQIQSSYSSEPWLCKWYILHLHTPPQTWMW